MSVTAYLSPRIGERVDHTLWTGFKVFGVSVGRWRGPIDDDGGEVEVRGEGWITVTWEARPLLCVNMDDPWYVVRIVRKRDGALLWPDSDNG